jgi:hypothetical protein
VIRLEAKDGFHVNADYPLSFRPDGSSPGITFEGERIDLAKKAERTPCPTAPQDACTVRARIPFRAAGPGRAAGIFAFSVCTPEQCLIEKVPVSAQVPAS